MTTLCLQEIRKSKQVFVYQSWAGAWSNCVSKVHLSCWTRWQKPARIKELGLWPTLTFSALSTWNESAPSSNARCDTGWATGWKEQWGVVLSHKHLPCGMTRSASVSPHEPTAHEQRGNTSVVAHDQGHYSSRHYLRKSTLSLAHK